ncbi:MAG: hypothetical protein E7617_06505 [Ruminococcaceae bacterium]|nr:hypothetical protein [Oscillospiraceae bacterium]
MLKTTVVNHIDRKGVEMKDFFTSVLNGTFDFNKLVAFFGSLFDDVKANEGVMGIWDGFMGAVSGFLPFLLIALGVIELLYGKKFLGIQKFVASAALGYCVGVLAVSPVVSTVLPIPEMVCGAVVALVAAVLCKQVYAVALFGGAGLFGYVICFAGGLIPGLPTVGNQVLSFAAAGVLIFLVLIFRKNIERLGLAFLGSYMITSAVINNFFNYTTLVPGSEGLIRNSVLCLIAVLGFVYQYKRRRRY